MVWPYEKGPGCKDMNTPQCYTYNSYVVQMLDIYYAILIDWNVTFLNPQFTLRHMLASGFSCSTRAGGCGSGGGNKGMSTELLTLLPRLLGTLPIPLVVRMPRFLPRLARVSGSTCTGSGSSTSDSVAICRHNASKGLQSQNRSMPNKNIWNESMLTNNKDINAKRQ